MATNSALRQVTFHVYPTGWAVVAVGLSIDGQAATQFLEINLVPDYETKMGYKLYQRYPGLWERNIGFFQDLAKATGVTLTRDDWTDGASVAEAFNREGAIGKRLTVAKQGRDFYQIL